MAGKDPQAQQKATSCLHTDDTFEEVPLTAPAATLQQGNHASSEAARATPTDGNFPNHSNTQTSFADTFRLPQPNTSNIMSSSETYSPINSPSLSTTFHVYHNTVRQEDFATKPRRANKLRLQNLFKGSSAPVQVGLPSSRQQEESDEVVESMPSPRNATKRPSMVRLSSARTSWFGSGAALNQHRQAADAEAPHDELLDLNIQDALFPHGPVDPLDPASFNDLLFNAESLISRLQTAYRAEKKHFDDYIAERSAQDDEVEEAKVRARHLKLQLDDMAAKAAEQDAAARALGEELAKEKLRREEEEDARKRSVMLVQNANSSYRLNARLEKLAARRDMIANGAGAVVVDNDDDVADSEDDDESSADSVFSHGDGNRAMAPVRSVTTACSSDVESPTHAQVEYPAPALPSLQARPSLVQRQSTFERVLGEISGKRRLRPGAAFPTVNDYDDDDGFVGLSDNERRRLYASIGELEEDNSSLRARVAQLESAVDGCLSLVHV